MDKLTQDNTVTLDSNLLQQGTVCNSPSLVLLVQTGTPMLADLQVSQSWTVRDTEASHVVSVDANRYNNIFPTAVSFMLKQRL